MNYHKLLYHNTHWRGEGASPRVLLPPTLTALTPCTQSSTRHSLHMAGSNLARRIHTLCAPLWRRRMALHCPQLSQGKNRTIPAASEPRNLITISSVTCSDHQGLHDPLIPSKCWSAWSLGAGRRIDRSWGISRMGVGATSLGAGFMLRSMSGGGDIGGEAEGRITCRTGAGRGAVTTTGGAEGDPVEGAAVAGGDEGTPDIAEAQDVR